jgi:hypothetical protein
MVKEPVVRLDAVGGRVISPHEDIVKATDTWFRYLGKNETN